MSDKQLKLQIITPDRVFFDGMIDMAVFSSTEGDMGVLYDHIPMTTLIESSLFQITQSKEEKIIAVHSGFVTIDGKNITVLTEVAEWPYEVDIQRAEQAKERAQKRIQSSKTDSEINLVRAELALKKALTRIEVAKYNKK